MTEAVVTAARLIGRKAVALQAFFRSPGGGFLNGAQAQEESLWNVRWPEVRLPGRVRMLVVVFAFKHGFARNPVSVL